jgi:hypothetical protein
VAERSGRRGASARPRPAQGCGALLAQAPAPGPAAVPLTWRSRPDHSHADARGDDVAAHGARAVRGTNAHSAASATTGWGGKRLTTVGGAPPRGPRPREDIGRLEIEEATPAPPRHRAAVRACPGRPRRRRRRSRAGDWRRAPGALLDLDAVLAVGREPVDEPGVLGGDRDLGGLEHHPVALRRVADVDPDRAIRGELLTIDVAGHPDDQEVGVELLGAGIGERPGPPHPPDRLQDRLEVPAGERQAIAQRPPCGAGAPLDVRNSNRLVRNPG